MITLLDKHTTVDNNCVRLDHFVSEMPHKVRQIISNQITFNLTSERRNNNEKIHL